MQHRDRSVFLLYQHVCRIPVFIYSWELHIFGEEIDDIEEETPRFENEELNAQKRKFATKEEGKSKREAQTSNLYTSKILHKNILIPGYIIIDN